MVIESGRLKRFAGLDNNLIDSGSLLVKHYSKNVKKVADSRCLTVFPTDPGFWETQKTFRMDELQGAKV